MLEDLDAFIVREPLLCEFEHEIGAINGHSARLWPVFFEEREHPPIARSEVEHTTAPQREMFEHNALSLAAMSITALQVALYVLPL